MLRHEKALQDYAQSHIEEQYRLRKIKKKSEDINKEDQQPRSQSAHQPLVRLLRLIMGR